LLGLPGVDRVTVDLRVLTITLAATLATGIAFGLVPAWAAVREGAGATLNEEGRSGTTGTYAQRVRAALVVAEMALSLMLLIGAGLLLVSFKRLVDVSPGFQPQRVVTMRVTLPAVRYDDSVRVRQFFESLLVRVRTMPGVESAGAVTLLPFGSGESRSGFLVDGRTAPSTQPVRAHIRLASPEYLATLRIPPIRGRDLHGLAASAAP